MHAPNPAILRVEMTPGFELTIVDGDHAFMMHNGQQPLRPGAVAEGSCENIGPTLHEPDDQLFLLSLKETDRNIKRTDCVVRRIQREVARGTLSRANVSIG
jgi:hypothetical protein